MDGLVEVTGFGEGLVGEFGFLHLTPDVLDVVEHGRVFGQPFDGKVQLVRSATGSVRTASTPRNAAWAFTGAGPVGAALGRADWEVRRCYLRMRCRLNQRTISPR